MILLRRLFGVAIVSWSLGFGPPQVRGEPACRVVQQEKRVELCSPFFAFRLDTAAGLRAESWENRLTGRELSLGIGPELEQSLRGFQRQALHAHRLGFEHPGTGESMEIAAPLPRDFLKVARTSLGERLPSALVRYRMA